MRIELTQRGKKALKKGITVLNVVADKKATIGDSLGLIDRRLGGKELTKMNTMISTLTKKVKDEETFKDVDKSTILNEVKTRLKATYGKKYVDLYEFSSNLRVGRTDVYCLEMELNGDSSIMKFKFKKYTLIDEFDLEKVKAVGEVAKSIKVVDNVVSFEIEDFRGVHRDAKDLNVNYVALLQDLQQKLEEGKSVKEISSEHQEALKEETDRLEIMINDLDLVLDAKTTELEIKEVEGETK